MGSLFAAFAALQHNGFLVCSLSAAHHASFSTAKNAIRKSFL
jgi:hypothetical protein